MKSVMVVHDMAPTVLPTGNDEDGTRKLHFLHLAFKIVSSAIIFIFSLERSENSQLQIPNQQRTVQHLLYLICKNNSGERHSSDTRKASRQAKTKNNN